MCLALKNQRTPNHHSIYKAKATPMSPRIPAAPGTIIAGMAAALEDDEEGADVGVGALLVVCFKALAK
jgi:hypothetical protein